MMRFEGFCKFINLMQRKEKALKLPQEIQDAYISEFNYIKDYLTENYKYYMLYQLTKGTNQIDETALKAIKHSEIYKLIAIAYKVEDIKEMDRHLGILRTEYEKYLVENKMEEVV